MMRLGVEELVELRNISGAGAIHYLLSYLAWACGGLDALVRQSSTTTTI
jgi:hypothetical protein